MNELAGTWYLSVIRIGGSGFTDGEIDEDDRYSGINESTIVATIRKAIKNNPMITHSGHFVSRCFLSSILTELNTCKF